MQSIDLRTHDAAHHHRHHAGTTRHLPAPCNRVSHISRRPSILMTHPLLFFLNNPNPKAFTYQPRPTTGPTLHLHLGSSRRSLLRRWCTPTASGLMASVQTTVHTCALACAAGTAPTTRPLFNTRLMPTAKHKQTQRRRCKSTLSPMAGGRRRNALTTRAAKACQTVTTILLRALPSCKSGQHMVPTIRTTTLL